MNFVKPMLARVYSEKKDGKLWESDEWAVEKKLNGHRILATKEVCYSRLGNEKLIPFIQEWMGEGLMLDGEVLPIDEMGDHSDVTHLLCERQEGLKFVVFDILYIGGRSCMEMPYTKRRNILEAVFAFFRSKGTISERVSICESIYDNKKQYAEKLIENGSEGVILKNVDSKYMPGSRSMFIKYKWFTDIDCVLLDCEGYPSEWTVRPGEIGKDGKFYPEGKHTESWELGYRNVRYGFFDESLNDFVVCGSLGVTGPKEELEKKYPAGSVAIVKVYGQSEDTGCLKHPVFKDELRDDKSARECTFCFDRSVITKNGIWKVKGA